MLAVGIVVGAEDSFESSGRLSDMLTGMPTVHTALWFGFKSRFSVQCEMGFSLETSWYRGARMSQWKHSCEVVMFASQ